MAAAQKKKPVTKQAEKEGLDFEGALMHKYGPLPAWGWLGIGGGALYLYRKLHPGTSTGASSTTTSADDGSGFGGSFTPLGDSGGAGSGGSSDDSGLPADVTGGGTGPDTVPALSDTNSTNGFGSTPAASGAGSARSGGGGVPTTAQVGALKSDLPSLSRAEFDNASASKAYSNPTLPVPASTTNFAVASAAKTAGAAAAGVPIAFGGVADVKTNKQTGVTTTTYANGRIVQQAPGKTAYVAKKGS